MLRYDRWVAPRPIAVARWLLRGAVLLPLALWGAQLAGRRYSVDVAMLEHAVLEPVLLWGWTLDEAVHARPVGALVAGLGLGAVASALLGAMDPRAAFVRWTQPLVALALAVPLGALFALGFALAPGTTLTLLGAALVARTAATEGQSSASSVPPPPGSAAPERALRWSLRGLIPGAALALLFAANLLATSRDGTWYDRATDLPGRPAFAVALLGWSFGAWLLRGRVRSLALAAVPVLLVAHAALAGPLPGLAWGGLACLVVGASVRLRALGLPALPDPARPTTWAGGLVLPSLVALAALVGNGAVEVQACPDAQHPAVTRLSDAATPFDLAWNGQALAVVHREQGWMRLLEADGALLHEVGPVEGDLEEVFALPGNRGFLLTEILDDAPFTLLRVVDVTTGRSVDHRLPGMCWISSMAWDAERDAVLLGCETQSDLLRFHPDGRLESVGRLPADDDLEDLHLRTDQRRAYAVSLAEGDQLWALDPDAGAVLAQRDLGGLNYSVVHDPGSDRVLVARFLDAQVVAFDADLQPVGRMHAGFGVRPLVGLPAHGLVLSASMFDGRLLAIDPDGPHRRAALRLGGRVKALDVDPEESRAWIGTTCGVFQVDLRRWLN